MTLFYLLSSGFFFILALGSKEDAVTLPIIVLFYYLFFISTTRNGLSPFRNNLKIILSFILLASIYPIVRYFKLGMAGIGDATGIFTPLTYLITELNVIIFYYLRLLFFPINLNVDPDIRPINSLFSPSTLISMVIIFLIVIVIVSYKFFRRDPIISFSIMWFFVTLMPTSSVFPLWDPAAEHRVYLPAVGFSIFLAQLIGKIGTKTRFFPRTYFMCGVRITNFVLCLFIIILLSFSLCTIKRNFIWKDRVSLWEDTVKKSPLKARPHAVLGLAYNHEKGLIDDAIRQYRIALGIKPFFFDALNNLGIALDMKGDLDGAMQKYQIAAMMKPDSTEIHNNIAIIYAKKGEIGKAAAEFKRSLEIAPDYIKAKKNLEMLLKGMADFEGSTVVDRYR
ncbi:MAG: tetratricopeptide repeat protein [Nitrospinota bacterium]